jgi:carbon-monoxide dehydrogenase medium subunit
VTGATFVRPRTLVEVHQLLAAHGDDARLVSGGTVIALLLRQRLLACSVLVSLEAVEGLSGIDAEGSGMRIGALCTYRAIERSHIARRLHPVIAETVAHVATPRIRNQGTIGGCLAIADPHFDLPVTLLALDATVKIASSRGTRELPLEALALDYYETALEPGEVITAVVVPPAAAHAGFAFTKFLTGSVEDYAAANVAVGIGLDEAGAIIDARVVLGALGPRVFRSMQAEAALRGARPTERSLSAAAEAAAEACDPDADTRGSSEYKRDLVRVLVPRVAREAFRRATDGDRP